MSRGFALRTASGDEKIATLTEVDPVTGDTIKGEQASTFGRVALFVPLVAVADAQAAGDEYPKGGTATGGSTTTIGLPAAVTVDPTGLLVVLTNNTPSGALGQVRRIASVSGSPGSYTATVGDWAGAALAWGGSVSPTSGTTFSLLIDCYRLNWLHIKPEFQNAKATDASAWLLAVFYGLPKTLGGAAAVPKRFLDREQQVWNVDITTDSSQSGYRQGTTLSVQARALGAKVRLVTPPSGKLYLEACAT
jgi:hypothetical protein